MILVTWDEFYIASLVVNLIYDYFCSMEKSRNILYSVFGRNKTTGIFYKLFMPVHVILFLALIDVSLHWNDPCFFKWGTFV